MWVTGWVAAGIISIIIVTFAVWGINFTDQNIQPVVASVNGEGIELQTFQQAYANSLEQRRQYIDTPLTLEQEEELKTALINNLVENEVIYQASIKHGLHISNEKVREVIEDIQAFNHEDAFDLDTYRNIIELNRMSPAFFENRVRSELLTKQLQSVVRDSIFVLQTEVTYLAQLHKQKRGLTYVLLSADELKDSIEIDDVAVQQFYESTTEGLLAAEQIKIAYLDLSVEKLAADIAVDEEMISIYYDDNKDQYDVEEQRKVDIANIKLDPESTDEDIAIATSKAEKIRALIDSGTSFTDIAEKHDDNSEPEMLVTQHGYVVKGVLPEDIDEIAFAMDEGELSEVLTTDNGLYVFAVSSIKGGIKNTLEYVREAVEKDYKIEQAERQYFDLADKLETSAHEHPDTLEVAAEIIGIDIQESDFFSRENASDLLANPKILAAGFHEDTIKSRENSEAIALDDNQIVILRVLDQIPAEKKPLTEVKEQIIKTLQAEEASEMQRQKGQDILAQLKQGIELTTISEALAFEWQQVDDPIERDDISVNRKILRTAFKLGQPDEGGIVFGGTEVSNEGYAVIVVKEVVSAETLADEDIDNRQSILQQSRSSAEWSSMLDALMEKASININANSL